MTECFIYSQWGYTGYGPSYTCASIAAHLRKGGVEPTLFTPRNSARLPAGMRGREAVGGLARKVPYRLLEKYARDRLDKVYLRAVQRAPKRTIANIWPEAPPWLIEELRKTDAILVREMINCTRKAGKEILDDAYARIGLDPRHDITHESADQEIASLAAMDFVFAPNASVEQSLAEAGVPSERIIPASYGWEPGRVGKPAANSGGERKFTAVFLGTVCVRKGPHLLMKAWADSKIDGRLILAGDVEEALLPHIRPYLDHGGVKLAGYVQDVASLFANADLFCFPSLEEGGPMVTYEAAGAGLPILASPMGAGRIAGPDNGFVIDPYHHEGWVEALRTLAASADLRRQMGAESRRKAAQFTWAEVGRRRGEALAAVARG